MRLHLKLTNSKTIIPFDHFSNIIGAVHKWIGKNEIHDTLSLYSLSRLKGSKVVTDGFLFENDPTFFISSFDNSLIKKIIDGVNQSPDVAYGMTVKELVIQPDPDFSQQERFFLASPVLIKRTLGKNVKHFTINDLESDALLIETMQNKFNHAGLNGTELSIKFDRNYPTPKIRVVTYKGIMNKVSSCPILMEGSPAAKAFAWNVGIGNSTGIGFGSLI